MTLYPVSGGKFINVAAIKRIPGSTTVYKGPWIEPTNAETVVELFENWEPKALAVTKVRLFYIMSTLARAEMSYITGSFGAIPLGNTRRTQVANLCQRTSRPRRRRCTLGPFCRLVARI